MSSNNRVVRIGFPVERQGLVELFTDKKMGIGVGLGEQAQRRLQVNVLAHLRRCRLRA
jgi:hypothetical protein